MPDVLIVGIPLIAIIAGILFNKADFNRLETRIDRIESDMKEFYRTLGQHDVRIEHLEKRPAN